MMLLDLYQHDMRLQQEDCLTCTYRRKNGPRLCNYIRAGAAGGIVIVFSRQQHYLLGNQPTHVLTQGLRTSLPIVLS